jgi:formate dehydrogenase subunit gamma
MKEAKFIKKVSILEIFNHWVLALTFFILVITGVGILYRVSSIILFFGGHEVMIMVHEWVGAAFGISLLFTAFSYLEESLHFNSDDMKWLKVFGGYFSKNVKVPPQGRLTATQKVFYLFILISGIVMTVSGLLLGQNKESAEQWVAIAYKVHKITSYTMIVLVPFHIIVVTLVIPQTLRAIFLGTMSFDWAKEHHAKWVSRRKDDTRHEDRS